MSADRASSVIGYYRSQIGQCGQHHLVMEQKWLLFSHCDAVIAVAKLVIVAEKGRPHMSRRTPEKVKTRTRQQSDKVVDIRSLYAID
jgi:hypothetical protein